MANQFLINRLSREKQVQENPFMGMSNEQLDEIEAQVKLKMAEQERGKIGRGISTASDLFLQMGGLTPPARQQQTKSGETLDDWIMKERMKSEMNPKRWQPSSREEALEFEEAKARIKAGGGIAMDESGAVPGMAKPPYTVDGRVPAVIQKQKLKDTSELVTTINQNEVNRKLIADAKAAAETIPQGLSGKLKKAGARLFNPNDPMLANWQKIKMVLTDAQLMNTAKTKGAISDREMALFSKAAANDDFTIVAEMKPVFDKLLAVLSADEEAKKSAFRLNYGEEPDEFLPTTARGTKQGVITATNPQTGQRIKSTDGGQTWQPM